MTNTDDLIALAREARAGAIAPYSNYQVGAAVSTPDGTFTGCNIEIVNYSNTLHAEEVAIAKALSEGVSTFDILAIATSSESGATPCGMCRQTLAEFCEPSLEILSARQDGFERYELDDLLPDAFTAEI